MNNIKKILIPVDFSQTSDNALGYASELLNNQKVEAIVLHVCPEGTAENEMASIENKLTDIVNRFAEIVSISYKIETGDLIQSIISVKNQNSADLIIMGTHGSEDDDEGTKTSRVVLEANCPVLVVPENQKHFSLKNIALALGENTIDNSGGLQALHDLARTFDATVHVLTINRNGESPTIKTENQELLEYYLESLLYFHAFPQNTDIEVGISNYVEEHKIDMLAILPRNHTQSTTPSEGRLTRLLTMHTKVPLLTID